MSPFSFFQKRCTTHSTAAVLDPVDTGLGLTGSHAQILLLWTVNRWRFCTFVLFLHQRAAHRHIVTSLEQWSQGRIHWESSGWWADVSPNQSLSLSSSQRKLASVETNMEGKDGKRAVDFETSLWSTTRRRWGRGAVLRVDRLWKDWSGFTSLCWWTFWFSGVTATGSQHGCCCTVNVCWRRQSGHLTNGNKQLKLYFQQMRFF